MWAFNNEWNVYWISNDAYALPSGPPPRASSVIVRPQDLDDIYYRTTEYVRPNGRASNYVHIVNRMFVEPFEVPAVITPFPKAPTYEGLKQYLGDKKSVIFDKDTALLLTGSEIVLRKYGYNVMGWGETYFHFLFNSSLLMENVPLLEPIKKYVGEGYEISKSDEIWGIKSHKSKWIPLFNGLTFTNKMETLNVNEEWLLLKLTTHQKLSKKIQQYLSGITCQSISEAAGNSLPNRNPIFTRCKPCQACESQHLRIHMARNDVDPYLIFSALEEFGPHQPLGGPIRLAWEVIESARMRDNKVVTEFKEVMKNFLTSCLDTRDCFITDHPVRREGARRKWFAGNTRQLRVDGQWNLVAAEPAEDGTRHPGEELAREQEANEPREARPLVGGMVFRTDAPITRAVPEEDLGWARTLRAPDPARRVFNPNIVFFENQVVAPEIRDVDLIIEDAARRINTFLARPNAPLPADLTEELPVEAPPVIEEDNDFPIEGIPDGGFDIFEDDGVPGINEADDVR